MTGTRGKVWRGAAGITALLLAATAQSCAADEAAMNLAADEQVDEVVQPLVTDGVLATPAALAALSGCADGTVEQTFGRGIVGCAGTASYENRASLCAAGYRPLGANGWRYARNATVPTHHYWTNDELRYSGSGSGACAATRNSGNLCPSGQPMRVCAAGNTDPEGNYCNWINCSFDGAADYFGGCVGNATAGTLCVPSSGCADGSVEQTFGKGTVGCAGAVSYASAASLCSAGYILAGPTEWVRSRGASVPSHNYWTDYGLRYYTGSSGACQVYGSHASAPACPADTPMRVCVPSGTDPEGNKCNWTGCTYSSGSNDYFGGCMGNSTAGAVCMPEGCADGSTEQSWNKFVHGCAGKVSQANHKELCNARGVGVNAQLWTSFRGNLLPTHNYWTNELLNWNGSGSGSCAAVRFGNGLSCGMGNSMAVCTSTGADAEGNSCVWNNCGLDNNSPTHSFGGCSSTAGVVCMTGP